MKKTIRTLMTAAMFATALGVTASGAMAAESVTPTDAAGTTYDPASTTEVPVPVYGPPQTTDEETTTTAAETTATTDLTDIPQVEYGPPFVCEERGDLNADGVVDVKDAALLRRWVMTGLPDYAKSSVWMDIADTNQDGLLDGRDVRTLLNYILRVTETLEPFTEEQTVYGPPSYFETTTESTITGVTETSTMTTLVYGPPLC